MLLSDFIISEACHGGGEGVKPGGARSLAPSHHTANNDAILRLKACIDPDRPFEEICMDLKNDLLI